ncbi:MAG: hypothetical protein NTW30_02825 [Candidatus Aenigmarchaeota archaeon]|nr:hypothetical protein [Candidatus Aenigmarchaeota archaeon]
MKGLLFTLESFIAILMIFFIIILLFQNPPASSEFNRINYKLKAYNGLMALEKTGELRKDAVNNNAISIQNKLNPYLPDFLNYTVVIFNETTNITAKPSLSLTNDSISVSYFLAGDVDDFKPREIRVYLWGY